MIGVTFPSTPQAAQVVKKDRRKGVLMVGGVVVVLGLAVGSITLFADGGRHGRLSAALAHPPSDDLWGAKWACERAVEDKLKAWMGADFRNESAAKIAEGEHRVTGSVETEDSAGKPRWSPFTCEVTRVDRYNLKVTKVAVSGR